MSRTAYTEQRLEAERVAQLEARIAELEAELAVNLTEHAEAEGWIVKLKGYYAAAKVEYGELELIVESQDLRLKRYREALEEIVKYPVDDHCEYCSNTGSKWVWHIAAVALEGR